MIDHIDLCFYLLSNHRLLRFFSRKMPAATTTNSHLPTTPTKVLISSFKKWSREWLIKNGGLALFEVSPLFFMRFSWAFLKRKRHIFCTKRQFIFSGSLRRLETFGTVDLSNMNIFQKQNPVIIAGRHVSECSTVIFYVTVCHSMYCPSSFYMQ